MKNLLYTALLILPGYLTAQSCNVTIPINVPIPTGGIYHIYADTTINDSVGSYYYLCAGITVTIEGSGGSVFTLEEGVSLTINATDGDNINAKGNCTIVDNTTEGMTAFMEASSTYSKPLLPAAVIITICPTMVYDYSLVGGSSPCGLATIDESNLEEELQLYPNPIQRSGKLHFGLIASDVMLYNLSGQLVADFTNLNSEFVQIGDLDCGIFIVNVRAQSGGSYFSRIVVN